MMQTEQIDLAGYFPLPVVDQLRYAILEKIRKGEDPLPDIHGREETKKDVLRALLSGSHPYLVSEEGTGKTRLSRSLSKLLPPIPVIKGCPYRDDPLWPAHSLCPRCGASKDPVKEYGIELVPGVKRFSRIQGNKYTNEAKMIGLKDIQAIAQGRSPSDPRSFTGTGIFNANRGLLFVDELPAIDTKVQVLLHPVLEEKKVILEEYSWEYPLDLVFIAAGNPQGFSHVNEVPRPLLDRLELIYMNLPDEETEREIMLREKFRVSYRTTIEDSPPFISYPRLEDLERRVIAPWWIIDLITRAVRHSRKCRWLERMASIRGTIRGLDHTYASVELENRNVATLKDVFQGLRLALRGRMGLTVDLMDFGNPEEGLRKTDEVTEDLLWNGIEDFDFQHEINGEKFTKELKAFLSEWTKDPIQRLQRYPEITGAIDHLKAGAREKVTEDLNEAEKKAALNPDGMSPQVQEEYTLSALEMILNLAWHKNRISREAVDAMKENVFMPHMVSWAQPSTPPTFRGAEGAGEKKDMGGETSLDVLAKKLAAERERQKKGEVTNAARYQCLPCGYIYDPEKGSPDSGIAPGTKFEDLPDDWVCPVCFASKAQFRRET